MKRRRYRRRYRYVWHGLYTVTVDSLVMTTYSHRLQLHGNVNNSTHYYKRLPKIRLAAPFIKFYIFSIRTQHTASITIVRFGLLWRYIIITGHNRSVRYCVYVLRVLSPTPDNKTHLYSKASLKHLFFTMNTWQHPSGIKNLVRIIPFDCYCNASLHNDALLLRKAYSARVNDSSNQAQLLLRRQDRCLPM